MVRKRLIINGLLISVIYVTLFCKQLSVMHNSAKAKHTVNRTYAQYSYTIQLRIPLNITGSTNKEYAGSHSHTFIYTSNVTSRVATCSYLTWEINKKHNIWNLHISHVIPSDAAQELWKRVNSDSHTSFHIPNSTLTAIWNLLNPGVHSCIFSQGGEQEYKASEISKQNFAWSHSLCDLAEDRACYPLFYGMTQCSWMKEYHDTDA